MCRIFVATVLIAFTVAASPAQAGDEVDYSAPYLVVENGELVTKYPDKEHDAGEPTAATVEISEATTDAADNPAKSWMLAVGAAVIVFALLAFARRRSKVGNTTDVE